MNRLVLMACVVVPLLAGCTVFRGNPVPPRPALTGIAAENAAWQNDIRLSPSGGAPTFQPLTDAQAAVKAAQAQPKVTQYDSADLSQAEDELAQAQSGWDAIANAKKRPPAKLAAIADHAHRAQRLAEIAHYTAEREINHDRVATLNQRVQQLQQQRAAAAARARGRRRQMAASGSSGSLVGQKVIPDRLGKLAFEAGTARLTPSSHAVVNRLAALLKKHPEYGVAIFGFTDNSAPDPQTLKAFMHANSNLAEKAKTHDAKVRVYNLALSNARARDVAVLLVHQGISSHRIGARGLGEQHPIASNDTAAGRRANERVEVFIVAAPKNGGGDSSS